MARYTRRTSRSRTRSSSFRSAPRGRSYGSRRAPMRRSRSSGGSRSNTVRLVIEQAPARESPGGLVPTVARRPEKAQF